MFPTSIVKHGLTGHFVHIPVILQAKVSIKGERDRLDLKLCGEKMKNMRK